jgi:hypothetical protein
MAGPSRSNRESRPKTPVGSGGRARERKIDRTVSSLAGGGKSSPPSQKYGRTGDRPLPSSYAPSGETPKSFEFGTPMQESGKPRPARKAE